MTRMRPSDRTALTGVRSEVIIGMWRIGEVIRCMDDSMTKEMKDRWERGVAREIVSVSISLKGSPHTCPYMHIPLAVDYHWGHWCSSHDPPGYF